LGYRDRAKIPYQKLHELKPPEGKEYYFVEGATVSSTTYRTFDEVGSTGTLEGTAFKANGKVYASGTGFAYTQTVAVDTFSVQALQPSAAAPADPGTKKIISLYQQHKIGELSPQGADELIGLLKEKSGDVAVLRGAELKGSVH